MSGRVIAGAVLVLVVVVGGILLVVGSSNGGDADSAPAPQSSRSPAVLHDVLRG